MAEPAEPNRDPRGRGFRSRRPVEDVERLILDRVAPLSSESVELVSAAGRILASDIVAPRPMPPFARAAMDGFAVRGEETYGSDPYSPAIFRVVGRSRPGARFQGTTGPGEAVAVATGSPMPAGADAVVPVEVCSLDGDILRVSEAVTPGRHVGTIGEDFEAGAVLLRAGRKLRPQDLGLLSAAASARVEVVRRPRIAVIVTGDELTPAGAVPEPDRIADMNSPMVRASAERDGAVVDVIGPLSDDRNRLRGAIARAAEAYDAVLISGGSSTGPEDHAPGLTAELGELPIHGVALRPASPTGIGFIAGVPVVLLPGNPVSCLCAYDLFAGRIVRRLGGRSVALPYPTREGILVRKLSSALGRVDYARVSFVDGRVEPISIGGASILTSTTRADGFVLIPADLEGYPPGATVTVHLYDAAGGD